MDETELSQAEKDFLEVFSSFVNGKMDNAKAVGKQMARDHRYLVGEKFKVVMAFLEQLAKDYQDGFFDARNENACHLAYEAIKSPREKELYYPTL